MSPNWPADWHNMQLPEHGNLRALMGAKAVMKEIGSFCSCLGAAMVIAR